MQGFLLHQMPSVVPECCGLLTGQELENAQQEKPHSCPLTRGADTLKLLCAAVAGRHSSSSCIHKIA